MIWLDIYTHSPSLRKPMLALDIETTGLNMTDPTIIITMVCLYDPEAKIRESYPLLSCYDIHTGQIIDKTLWDTYKDQIIQRLQEATTLCAYNGISFDLPFLATKLDQSDDILGQWVQKTVDMLHTSFLLTNRMFSLQKVLQLNGLESKTGSGANAILLARQGNIEALQEYCMKDTQLTWDLCNQEQWIQLPVQWMKKPIMWGKGQVLKV